MDDGLAYWNPETNNSKKGSHNKSKEEKVDVKEERNTITRLSLRVI